MRSYILRRLLILIPLLIGVSIITFFITRLAPGDPVLMFVNVQKGADPARLTQLRHELGLDQPIWIQYAQWFRRIIRGDWGYSFMMPKPVLGLVLERLPNTLKLGGLAFLLALVVSIPVGVLSAVRQYSLLDYSTTVTAFVGISIPSFWLALMLIYIFNLRLRFLPAMGMHSTPVPAGAWAAFVDSFKHYLMPTIVLSFQPLATWTRYVRSSMLEALRQDYVRTARSKGLSERVAVYKHALRNALIAPITIIGMTVPMLFNGAYIIEQIFAWPGMGRLGVDAVFKRDYPIVMGVTIMSAVVVAFANLLADLGYAWADPRIRYD